MIEKILFTIPSVLIVFSRVSSNMTPAIKAKFIKWNSERAQFFYQHFLGGQVVATTARVLMKTARKYDIEGAKRKDSDTRLAPRNHIETR